MDDKANYVGQSLEFFVRNEGEFYTSVSDGFYAFIVLWCMAYGPESVFVISKTKKGHWYVPGPGGKTVAGIEPTSSESQNKTKQNPGQTKDINLSCELLTSSQDKLVFVFPAFSVSVRF